MHPYAPADTAATPATLSPHLPQYVCISAPPPVSHNAPGALQPMHTLRMMGYQIQEVCWTAVVHLVGLPETFQIPLTCFLLTHSIHILIVCL